MCFLWEYLCSEGTGGSPRQTAALPKWSTRDAECKHILFGYWWFYSVIGKFSFQSDSLKAEASAGNTQATFKSTHWRHWSPNHGNATQRWGLCSSSPLLFWPPMCEQQFCDSCEGSSTSSAKDKAERLPYPEFILNPINTHTHCSAKEKLQSIERNGPYHVSSKSSTTRQVSNLKEEMH